MLDAIDALDDGLQRLGDELDGVLGLQAVGLDDDIDHRHGNLRLFLARQGHEREQAERQRRDQQQRRQRRGDEGAGERAGKTERPALTGATGFAHGTRTLSPAQGR